MSEAPRRALLTARLRAWPDFFIVGAQKAGTTSLYSYLAEHPQVLGTREKEIHYYTFHYARGADWYRSHFPSYLGLLRRRLQGGGRVITGEATPYYLFHPHACARIARDRPQARILIMLRNPAERAYSHYQHSKRAGWEPLEFADAIAAESQRLAAPTQRLMQNEHATEFAHASHSYVARGLYLEQIQRYENAFGRERILVINSEDFFRDTLTAYRRVLDFLGLTRFEPPSIREQRALNVGGYDSAQASTLAQLREFYEPHNERLYAYLGRRYDW